MMRRTQCALCRYSDRVRAVAHMSRCAKIKLTSRELVSDLVKKCRNFALRSEVSDALGRRHVRDELPIPGRQISVATRQDLVTRHCAAPERAVLWPAFRVCKHSLDETLRHAPIVDRKRQIDVDQGISYRASLPHCG